ncbi:unnamed protein product [Musa textilis]
MKCSLLLFLLLLLFFFIIFSSTSKLSGAASIVRTIAVDPNHKGDFTSIQEAIDSIPNNNTHWIKIHVAAGVYREKVNLSQSKRYVFLEGEGAHRTSIEWGDHSPDRRGHGGKATATFTSSASSFVAAGISFKNTYDGSVNIRQALAAAISGDKSSFYNCSFIGFQDTLFDRKGRHYFKDCYIEGVMDFIFGNGQSIYEGCTISLIRSAMKPGFMTAQGRGSPKDPGGFVFKSCNVTGFQETYLGRAWGAYSRVIFYRTFMSGIIIPQGWYAWNAIGHEGNITYAESECIGPGSDHSRRVEWERKLSDVELRYFIHMTYIDREGWLNEQPKSIWSYQ